MAVVLLLLAGGGAAVIVALVDRGESRPASVAASEEFVARSLEELANASDAVVEATILDVGPGRTVDLGGDNGLEYERATLRVDRILEGRVVADVVLVEEYYDTLQWPWWEGASGIFFLHLKDEPSLNEPIYRLTSSQGRFDVEESRVIASNDSMEWVKELENLTPQEFEIAVDEALVRNDPDGGGNGSFTSRRGVGVVPNPAPGEEVAPDNVDALIEVGGGPLLPLDGAHSKQSVDRAWMDEYGAFGFQLRSGPYVIYQKDGRSQEQAEKAIHEQVDSDIESFGSSQFFVEELRGTVALAHEASEHGPASIQWVEGSLWVEVIGFGGESLDELRDLVLRMASTKAE